MTRRGFGYRVGNWCCHIIWWACIGGIVVLSARQH